MRYFSEETVKEIVREAEYRGLSRSCEVMTYPLDISDYPSIEIPYKYGDLIDRDELTKTGFIECSSKAGIIAQILNAPIVLEANK